MTSVTAFAPASVGNACVGFDVLGFAFPVAGDHVTVATADDTTGIGTNIVVEAPEGLPTDPESNTASVALAALLNAHPGDPQRRFRLRIDKGTPLSAGMGGSAASAVAAVVAGNELLGKPFEQIDLLPFALEGEAVASGGFHSDNVAPSLLGGLTATTPGSRPLALRLPIPEGIDCVLVHPHIKIDTRAARDALSDSVALDQHVAQSANVAAFVSALHRSDIGLLRLSMRDLVVEPQRAHLVPGFRQAQASALRAGAITCAISGSGPSVFAWVERGPVVAEITDILRTELSRGGIEVDSWVAPPGGPGSAVTASN